MVAKNSQMRHFSQACRPLIGRQSKIIDLAVELQKEAKSIRYNEISVVESPLIRIIILLS